MGNIYFMCIFLESMLYACCLLVCWNIRCPNLYGDPHYFCTLYALGLCPCFFFLIWPVRLWYEGNLVINYLASRSADLEHFVTTSLIQLVCRVTKFGWFDDDKFQEIVSDSVNFLNQVSEYSPLHISRNVFTHVISIQTTLLPPFQNIRNFSYFFNILF